MLTGRPSSLWCRSKVSLNLEGGARTGQVGRSAGSQLTVSDHTQPHTQTFLQSVNTPRQHSLPPPKNKKQTLAARYSGPPTLVPDDQHTQVTITTTRPPLKTHTGSQAALSYPLTTQPQVCHSPHPLAPPHYTATGDTLPSPLPPSHCPSLHPLAPPTPPTASGVRHSLVQWPSPGRRQEHAVCSQARCDVEKVGAHKLDLVLHPIQPRVVLRHGQALS